MKKLFCLIALLALAFPAAAQIIPTNSLSLQAVASTTVNGTAFSLGGINLPTRQHIIQHTGIPPADSTNALAVNVQVSFDNTNWTTIHTYKPSSTNAVTELYAPSPVGVTCYMRVQAVTTNTITVGVTSVKP